MSSNHLVETIMTYDWYTWNWFSLICVQCHVGETPMRPDSPEIMTGSHPDIAWNPLELGFFSLSIDYYCELPDTQKSHQLGYHKVPSPENSPLNSFMSVKQQRTSHTEPEKPFKLWSILTAHKISWWVNSSQSEQQYFNYSFHSSSYTLIFC